MIHIKDISNITKLAGFEHTEYIQGNCSHSKIDENYIPLFIGKTVRNGNINTDFDWYIPLSLSEKLPRSQLRKKCIVLPYVGAVGDLAIYDGSYPAHLGSNIAKIENIDESKCLIEFLYYYLKSPIGQKKLLKDIQGCIQKNITMEAIRNVELPDISLEVQHKIVSVLSKFDNQIKSNINMIHKLQVLALQAFDYYSQSNSSKNTIILSDIIIEKAKSKIQVNATQAQEGTIPFFTSGEAILYTKNTLTTGFNIFLSTGGNAKVQQYYGDVAYSTDTWCITAKNNLQFYLYGYLKHIESQMDELFFHGTGLKHLQKPLFLNSKINVPIDELLAKYNAIVAPIYYQISKLQRFTFSLQQLKKNLLPLLINQQLI